MLFKVFGNAQTARPALFSSPMNVPLLVTAGFGELRPDHFHSGIDFSTYGKEQQIFAAAEGYVSRIRVATGGYGKAIYLNHPNGLTTVYAHLSSFNEGLNSLVKNLQERGRDYELDIILDSAEYPVKPSELIGYSGNSGSSTAPHLHFEVRDQFFENTLNPFLYGFLPADHTAPDIRAVSIFPQSNYGTVNSAGVAVHLPLVIDKKSRKKTFPPKQKMPVVSGWVGFGFQGGDVIGKQKNASGIYQVKLLVDSQLVFHSRFDEFSFHETRCINAYLDYPSRKKGGQKIQKCIVPPNNMIGIYKAHQNRGLYYFDQDKEYQITYVLADANGNKTRFDMRVKGKKPAAIQQTATVNVGRVEVLPGIAQKVSASGFEAVFGEASLFDTAQIKVNRIPLPGKYSDQYELGSIYIPLNQPVTVKLKPRNFPDSLRSKLLIGRREGVQLTALNSSWKAGWLEAQSNQFGDFRIEADTVAPIIKYVAVPVPKKKGKKEKKSAAPASISKEPKGLVRFSVTDRLSGVAGFEVTLNGNLIIPQPLKTKQEWGYRFADNLMPGEYVFQVTAVDRVENRRVFSMTFIQPEPPANSP